MSVSITILGDIMLGENHYHFGRGISTNYSKRYPDMITPEIRSILFERDILLFNMECSLGRNSNVDGNIKDYIYKAEDEALALFPSDALKIANIANNHFSQHGQDSAIYTKEILRKKGFRIIGELPEPEIIEIKDKVIKFWGVSLIKDIYYCNQYFLSDYDKLLDELSLEPKREDEIWVISIHWGDEYVKIPSEKQIRLGHSLSDIGFDIIAGHHPHVIQTVQNYGKSIITYSLGNFIFDQNYSKETKRGLAVIAKLNSKDCNYAKIEAEYYQTYQKNYQIIKIERYNNIKKEVTAHSLYNQRKKIKNLIMRILMKLELLVNIKEGNIQIIKFLLKRSI